MGLALGMVLLSTLADAASVVTARRAATKGMGARVRRGTARGILTARENMASAAMRSGRIGIREEGVDDAEDRCKCERSPKDYSSGLLRNSSAPIGYSVWKRPDFPPSYPDCGVCRPSLVGHSRWSELPRAHLGYHGYLDTYLST